MSVQGQGGNASKLPRLDSHDAEQHLGADLGQRDVDGIFFMPEKYDPNSRWHRLRKAAATSLLTAPRGTASIYADIPFTHGDWKKHRNAAFRHRMQPMLFLRVAGGFWWHLLYVIIVSVLVGLWHSSRELPKGLSSSKLLVPFNMTTFALSLLLVFRTNSSYGRWWEARMVWGAVVNLSRNFARQALLWLPPTRARVAVRWMMAAPFLLKCHLRMAADPRHNVAHILLPEEVEWLMAWTHKPNCAAHVLSTCVAACKLDTNRELVLVELINAFIDCTGKCERIFKTPIPPAYTRHTSRYLMLYLTAVPFVLWGSTGWWTPIAAMVVTFLLLGTENIGVQIEEPFRVLPLDDMCRGIENALREMERQHNSVAPNIAKWQVDPEGLERASESESSGPPSPSQGTVDIPAGPKLQAAAGLLQRALSKGTRELHHLPDHLHHLPQMLHLKRTSGEMRQQGGSAHGAGDSRHTPGDSIHSATSPPLSGRSSAGDVHLHMGGGAGLGTGVFSNRRAGGNSMAARTGAGGIVSRSHAAGGPYLPTVSSSGSEGEGEDGEGGAREGRRRRQPQPQPGEQPPQGADAVADAAPSVFAAYASQSWQQGSQASTPRASIDAGLQGRAGGAGEKQALLAGSGASSTSPGAAGAGGSGGGGGAAAAGGLHHRAAGNGPGGGGTP